ncbi:MAG: hypothetical protein JSV20_06915 [Candidatus Bathyarchaeota archaeon]|nr:MAG: hypothetical protein JSV20_06915 [Candidatus Bathyarchaeota archaeon]
MSQTSNKKIGEKITRTVSDISTKLKNYLSSSTIVAKLTPEQEETLINKIARTISKFGLEMPAGIFLEIFKPVSHVGANLILLPSSPFLYLFGVNGYQYVSLLEKRENIERLLERINEDKSDSVLD